MLECKGQAKQGNVVAETLFPVMFPGVVKSVDFLVQYVHVLLFVLQRVVVLLEFVMSRTFFAHLENPRSNMLNITKVHVIRNIEACKLKAVSSQ